MFKLFSEHRKSFIFVITLSVLLLFILTSIVINTLLACVDQNGCIRSWCVDSQLKEPYLIALKDYSRVTCRSGVLSDNLLNYTRPGYPY